MTLTCTQDPGLDRMYWYRQDLGHGLRLIHFSAGVHTSKPGDMPHGYSVTRSNTENSPLMLESAKCSQTVVYMSAHSATQRTALSAFLPLSPCGKGM